MSGWFRRLDPRLFVLVNNSLLLVLGMAFAGLQRDWSQITLAIVAALAVELLGARLTRKHAAFRLWDRVLSAAVAAVSTVVLLRSDVWWFYGALAALAILSKYVILDDTGKHVFNPTNFAIVFALALLPDYVQIRPDDYSSSYALRLMIPFFGLLAVMRGARWRCTAGYYAAVLLFGLPAGVLLGVKPLWIIAPELNTSTMIFAFLMITDPKSSPSAARSQVAFGVGVGLMHLVMRYTQIPYSPFVALFAMTALRSAWPRGVPDARSTAGDRPGLAAG